MIMDLQNKMMDISRNQVVYYNKQHFAMLFSESKGQCLICDCGSKSRR